MFRHLLKRSVLVSAVIAAPKVDSIVSSLRLEPKDSETGWDRVYNIFTVDKYGNISPQLSTIYQTTILTGFIGACWGGFLHSRDSYVTFVERNQATKFTDHYEAKKKLQDFVTVNFAKGAFRWSWRIALFSTLYVSFVTVLSSYFGDPSIWHYGLSGLLSGGIYKVNLGLRGMIIGGTLGLMIGLFAGALTLTLLRLTGTTLDDVHHWQHELSETRMKHLAEASKKSAATGNEFLLEAHDERLENVTKAIPKV